ncbi:hypothetical protein EJB05_56970, partial [Eragrostis curvula]
MICKVYFGQKTKEWDDEGALGADHSLGEAEINDQSLNAATATDAMVTADRSRCDQIVGAAADNVAMAMQVQSRCVGADAAEVTTEEQPVPDHVVGAAVTKVVMEQPSPGAKKIKSGAVKTNEASMQHKKQQHKPPGEFSVAECIAAIREMVDVSNEEKVLACDLFRDDVNREIFLSLDATLRTLWLKKQLTKLC